MNATLARQGRNRKRRVKRRLRRARKQRDQGRPVLPSSKVTYEMSDRVAAMTHGGLAAVHAMVGRVGLVERVDEALHVLKTHRPYQESDHVLNIAYNLLCGGRTLQDIELRRNDEVFLDALGVQATPDPTTAGDFCRRFAAEDVEVLTRAINEPRVAVWQSQPSEFTRGRARIDADGTLVATHGE